MSFPLTLPLVLLVGVLVVSVSVAAFAWLDTRQRRDILMRADAGVALGPQAPILITQRETLTDRLGAWIAEHTPGSLTESAAASEKLLHAGIESRGAVSVYMAIRLAFGIAMPLGVFLWFAGTGEPLTSMLEYVGVAAAAGFFGPPAVVDRMITIRRDKLRRAIPDALDLLVVCVEAGVSLDAAILRVARDIGSAHPELAAELMFVNRRVNAGVPREQALYGLWTRTGIEELRGLAANMVQSERWGTSIARVLRVNAETLRRKRKQTAEKKAAEASLKMLGPLVLFLFPALFVVILGPAVLRITEGLK